MESGRGGDTTSCRVWSALLGTVLLVLGCVGDPETDLDPFAPRDLRAAEILGFPKP